MPTYTVHEPPPRQGEKGESVASPERFVFVRDGFYFWAFVLAPVWLLLRRLWLALVIYLVFSGVLGFALSWLRVSTGLQFLAEVMVALGVGFEAASIWRWTLTRRGWKTLGFVVSEDQEMAERRFYAAWSERTPAKAAAPPSPPPQYAAPVWRGPPQPSDVIGLFPEPGGSR
jgi:hypothetical protein